MTLRRLSVLIRYLPRESGLATELATQPYWTPAEHLLDDIRMALTGSVEHPAQPHPQRPLGVKKQFAPKQIADARRRRAERERAIEAGEIT